MVGGPGFESAKYNITTQGIGRQPGSSFKPFVLAAALQDGISPKSTINAASPCSLPNPGGTPDPWKAENYEGSGGGVMDLYSATKHSMNCAYARLALIVGLDRVASVATRVGITTPLLQVPSMALGSIEVRPIDMAAAYATFANDGVYAKPYVVDEVLDRNGHVVLHQKPETHRAITSATARLVTDVLRGVVQSGTGTKARFKDGRPVAGKTGTTSDYADAWFVGYTPQLSTAVWMGSPTGTADKMRNVGGIRVTGGSFPATIWQAYMGPALEGQPFVDFAKPAKVERGTYLHLQGEPDHPHHATTTTTAPGAPSGGSTSTTVIGDTPEPPPDTVPPEHGHGNGHKP
jgi:penicillin-binding protein 1A